MHLRLCGFPAMAPALTEAASQAQNFKLPYTSSPASAESAPAVSLLGERNHKHHQVKKGIEFEEAAQGVRKRLLYSVEGVANLLSSTGGQRSTREEVCMMNCSGKTSEDVVEMGMMKNMSMKMKKLEEEKKDICKVELHQVKSAVVDKNRMHESVSRQTKLQRRCDFLLRRLQKMQCRQVERHVHTEIGSLVEYEQKTLQLPSRRERLQQGLKAVIASSGGNVNNSDLKSEILQCEDVKNLSTAALVNLVRKLESSHGSPHRQKYVTLQHLRSVEKVENAATGVKIPDELCNEMRRVSATLLANVKHLEAAIDSDATESSSGGESCDELDGFDEKKQHSVPINKRAAWKWSMDRSAVASRWTWLQAQVSDLEYKIRHQNDAYYQLRTNKGNVQLEGADYSLSPTTPSRLGQNDKRNETKTNRVNGLVNNKTSPPSDDENVEEADEATCTASRTRPLKSFRKRKLLNSHGLYRRSHKAAKLCTVKCACPSLNLVPCVMCGGRVNNTVKLQADSMPLEERVALLDPSFHAVLSFDHDVVTQLRFEALIRNGDWHRVGQKPKVTAAARKRGRLTVGSTNDVHKRSRKLKKNATATLTAKLKKKLNQNKRPRGRSGSLGLNKRSNRIQKKRTFSHMSLAMKKQRERNLSGSSGSSSKPSSPVPSLGDNSMGSSVGHKDHPRKSSMLQDLTRRRRGESAFDINNIVIPYNSYAATRVERLQYKEILTPKWRLAEECEKEEPPDPVPKDNGLVAIKSEDEETPEDLSDEVFDVRHTKCEREEKKRYLGYVKPSHHHPHAHLGGRGRPRNMRTDSRCDSSGANTPDPMSPYPMEQHESPITTPPSTPAPVVIEENLLNSRRRTTSLSKKPTEEFRSATPEIEEDPVSPWDKRTFPLNDTEFDEMVKISIQTPPASPPSRRSSTEETATIGGEKEMSAPPITEMTAPLPPPLPLPLPPPPPPPPPPLPPASLAAAGKSASRPGTPTSSSSTSLLGDDPNDPEWTVSTMSGERGPRPGIVIKLAKR